MLFSVQSSVLWCTGMCSCVCLSDFDGCSQTWPLPQPCDQEWNRLRLLDWWPLDTLRQLFVVSISNIQGLLAFQPYIFYTIKLLLYQLSVMWSLSASSDEIVLFVGQAKVFVFRSNVSSLGQSVVRTRCLVRNNFYCMDLPQMQQMQACFTTQEFSSRSYYSTAQKGSYMFSLISCFYWIIYWILQINFVSIS